MAAEGPARGPNAGVSSTSAGSGRAEERLDSWKEIAAYLNRGARTVQRWEQEEGLPVHRLRHDKRGTVYAYKPELDAWWIARRMDLERQREDSQPDTPDSNTVPAPAHRLFPQPLLATVLLVLAGMLVYATWLATRSEPPPAALRTVPLTTYPGVEISPAFSPDGKRVAFVWEGQQMENMDVYVKEIGSETSLRLTTDSRPEFNPVWSPDGGSIAFMRTAMKSTDEIYIVSLYGGAERKVAEISTPRSDTPEPYLAWSRDGRWLIVPERQSALEPFGLTMISLESGQTRKLTVAPAQSLGDSAPAVSRDGKTLAFVRCKSVRVCDIWLLDLMPSGTPAGSPRRLTTEGAGITSPVWMPNGQEILYIRSQGEIASLWRVAASGGHPPAVVNAVGNPGQEVDISPQGDKLVTAPVNADRNLYRIELSDAGAAVGKPQKLTTSTSSDHSPSISPDGNRLAFLSYRTGSSEIWVSRPDGTEARRLTSFNGPQTAAPRWSPDSRTIVFDARVDGDADLYTVNAEGGAVRRVTRAPANEFAPSWSWDGSWIYYTSDRTGERQIWKIPAAGGDEAQVTRKGGVGPRESADGKWVYYAKTYSYSETSIWRASPAGGEESRVFDSAWSYFNFFPLQDGILYSHSYVEGKGYPIMYHRFSSGRHEQVLTTQHRVAIGLSAWPISKARHVYFADWEIPNGDLMLVENFR